MNYKNENEKEVFECEYVGNDGKKMTGRDFVKILNKIREEFDGVNFYEFEFSRDNFMVALTNEAKTSLSIN
ncbi:MAG: hypothetical protein IJM82_06010 [Synergistaceae bacterium]|nr:hypothetical protein [Synergistaceae bacterium]MBQ6738331.1 hypothetical protein [Synergistaceae bacterium]MBQ7068703.1 hypothetical protein [Synergistaceae bacterium]MBR0074615.1 hypothetical protein [Synergistaceae bacterium]MBR0080835.1 hypothetical protein [Synergistaceae bacterium]